MLLIANCVSINFIPQNEIVPTNECPDFSRDCEHSHTHNLEEDVLNYETIIRPHKLDFQKGILFFANINFKNSFISQIWQPPKNS